MTDVLQRLQSRASTGRHYYGVMDEALDRLAIAEIKQLLGVLRLVLDDGVVEGDGAAQYWVPSDNAIRQAWDMMRRYRM